jgi:subtilisin family serine protease
MLAAIVGTHPAVAQSSMGEGGLVTIYTRELSAQKSQSANALLQKADARGRVRVIIGLDVDMSDASELTAAQQESRTRALESVQTAVSRRTAVTPHRKYEVIPFMSAVVTRAQLERLLNDPQVVSIQEDGPVLRPMLDESVPLIRANRVWTQKGFTGAGQVVAVLDTGAQYSHPMFNNKVVAGFCRSTTGSGTTSTCPGGVASSNALNSGRNCVGQPGCFHGTHVSSIAIGNTAALRGVARSARLISGKIFSLCPSCPQGTTAFFDDVTSGLERVFQLRNQFRIASVNMSIGTSPPNIFDTACDNLLPATAAIINQLFNARIATVISSGNDGLNSGISAPACINRAIAVGSTTKADAVSSFSNHHALVDVMAPGSDIMAAVLGGGFGVASGTSMASPHIAGVVALLKDARQNATVSQILTALKASNVNVTRNGVTKKRVDAFRAVGKLEQLLPTGGEQAVAAGE